VSLAFEIKEWDNVIKINNLENVTAFQIYQGQTLIRRRAAPVARVLGHAVDTGRQEGAARYPHAGARSEAG
jgi:demethoxyubiquinone hydroxylase (CLK1/Coq7/Cat5 family)